MMSVFVEVEESEVPLRDDSIDFLGCRSSVEDDSAVAIFDCDIVGGREVLADTFIEYDFDGSVGHGATYIDLGRLSSFDTEGCGETSKALLSPTLSGGDGFLFCAVFCHDLVAVALRQPGVEVFQPDALAVDIRSFIHCDEEVLGFFLGDDGGGGTCGLSREVKLE